MRVRRTEEGLWKGKGGWVACDLRMVEPGAKAARGCTDIRGGWGWGGSDAGLISVSVSGCVSVSGACGVFSGPGQCKCTAWVSLVGRYERVILGISCEYQLVYASEKFN